MLVAGKKIKQAELDELDAEIKATVIAAANQAKKMPEPDADDLMRHIYAA